MIYTMDTVCLFGREANQNHLSLSEGEAVFYTQEEAMRRMLRALTGVSGAAQPGVQPRLCIADADDGESRAAALSAAVSDGAPVIFYGGAFLLPPDAHALCLPRPFPLDAFCGAAQALLGGELPPERRVSPLLLWDEAERTISCGGQSVRLSAREAAVFGVLYASSPEPVPLSRLAQEFESARGNGTAVYVSYLRRRLAQLPVAAAITFERERGYALLLQHKSPDHDEEERNL